MSRPQFETMVINATRENLSYLNLDSSDIIQPGETHVIYIFADPGTIARVVSMYFATNNMPNATSGKQRLLIDMYEPLGAGGLLMGENDYNAALRWMYSKFEAASSAHPSTDDAQITVLQSIEFDSNIGLQIRFTNATDAVKNTSRSLRFTIVQRTVQT